MGALIIDLQLSKPLYHWYDCYKSIDTFGPNKNRSLFNYF
jgi:hypothetical protein